TVGGGVSNTASGDYAAVAGGQNNLASHNYATVSGGQNNTASSSHATVGGGSGNTASNRWATVGGGYLNTASGDVATISGGYGNTASNYATVGGGIYNHAEGPYATVAGGDANTASGNYAIVGGGYGNLAAADYATIAGGGYSDPGSFTGHNRVTDNYGTIGGGGNNQAGDAAGTTDDAPYATVGGGRQNTASDDYTTIGGGRNNTASSQHATVGGGINNTASGTRATVGGGEANMASGYRSIVPGGVSNWALGDHSFAAGRRAKANHQGTFVWGDSTDADVASTGNNQFIVRASGGVYLYTSSDLSTGVYLAPGSGSWTPIPVPSDRNLKENFTPVDGQEMLARLAEIPITTWNYKSQDPAVRHIGPMAQDFYAAFSLGEDDEHISTVDADGVTLAAIQGLYQLLQEKEAQVASLSSQVASQQAEIDDLGTRLAALEQQSAIRNPQPVLSRAEGSAIPWLLLAGVAVSSVWLTQRRRGGQ
ncbi:MAG: hypothetical protein FJ014_16835, partial [Chloroflexi bacterium]|nr:hypothetical protein [Chloroflexota bacterium]